MSSSPRALLLRSLALVPFAALAAVSQLDCSAGANGAGGAGGTGGGGTFATTVAVTIVGIGQVDVAGKSTTKTCARDAMGTLTGECTSQWAAGDPPTLTAKSTDASAPFQLWADGVSGSTVSTMPTLKAKEGDNLKITALFSGVTTTSSGMCMNGPACCPNMVCPDTVIDQLPSIAGLAEQGSDLYYLGSVEKVAKAGGMAKQVVQGVPGSFAVDATDVYWVDATGITLWKTSNDGSATVKVASLDGKQYPHALAMDATDIYMTWMTTKGAMDCPAVVRVPKTGADPVVIAEACDAKPAKPYAIALNDTEVFLGTIAQPTGGSLYHMPKNGMGAVAAYLTGGQNTAVTRIAVDGSTVYYLLNGLLVLDVANPGGATHVPTMLPDVAAFAIDGKDVVMVGSGGVARLDRASMQETLLAHESGTTLAMDATHVYWGSGTSGQAKILKIAR